MARATAGGVKARILASIWYAGQGHAARTPASAGSPDPAPQLVSTSPPPGVSSDVPTVLECIIAPILRANPPSANWIS